MDTKQRYVLAEISDSDFDANFIFPIDIKDYGVRKASRGILIRDGMVAVLFVSKENYHKLPGGGIEGNETNEEAFTREIREETGCDCKIDEIKNQNSIVIETRDKYKLLQISYAFFSEAVGVKHELALEQGEIDEGFELQWVPAAKVIELIENDKPNNYEGKFIQKRDLTILNLYKDSLSL